MPLTERELNRATLARQLLLARADAPVTDAVSQVVSLQAQEPASPYIALWNRVVGFDPADLDTAFRRHQIVKATLMRITLHAVHVDDYPAFHEAMQETLRAARYNDRRFLDTGVSPDDADSLMSHLADYLSEPRSRDEIEAAVADRLSAPQAASWVWWALRQVGSFWHAPSNDPWSFGSRPAYVSTRLQEGEDRENPVQVLIRRYLSGFGPASAQDIAQFALLRQSTLRPTLSEMSDLVEMDGPDGRVLLDVSEGVIPEGDTPSPPRLMAMWDSTLLAYKDRSRIIPDRFRKLVIRRNGDVLPTVLIDGYVAGVWRPVDDGIEVTAFQTLDDDTWDELADEARPLLEMLAERDPKTYSRYGRWWAEMPEGYVRVLQ